MNEEKPKQNSEIDMEECIRIFYEEGRCEYCMDKRSVIQDAGLDTEYTEDCPVCNLQEDDSDFYRQNQKDNNL